MTEDEMVGWHHRLNGHKSEQTPGDSEGQKSRMSMGLQRVRHDLAIDPTTRESLILMSQKGPHQSSGPSSRD